MGDRARLGEPVEAERLLVGGDLEHTVGRGVADRFQRREDARRQASMMAVPGGMAVLEDARQAGAGAQVRDDLAGSRGRYRGNSPSRTGRGRRRSPSARTACPCPSRSRRRSRIAPAAGPSRKAPPAPVRWRCGRIRQDRARRGTSRKGPSRRPGGSPRPIQHASAMSRRSAPAARRSAPRRGRRRCRRNRGRG